MLGVDSTTYVSLPFCPKIARYPYRDCIEIFGKPDVDRILSRVTFHSTPLHASWVNIAEIELSAMTRPISPH